MRRSVERLLYAIAALALLASSASGGALLGDGAAVLSGTEAFPGTFSKLNATVEYAVYAPGAFGSSAALLSPGNAAEPSNGAQFVYAYEIFNPAKGSVAISSFSVGLFDNPDVITDLTFKGYLANAGGTAPFKSEFIPTTALPGDVQNVKFSFGSPGTTIPLGGHSHYLLFTSPYEPGSKNSSIIGIGDLSNKLLPSPIPEPSTALLGLIGGLSLLAIAGYRRRHRV
jgi:hypothetical protein